MTSGAGRLFVVVGPSGVGKDSLLDYARGRLGEVDHIRFVRRTITRPVDSGGEVHDAMTEEAFLEMERQGGFAVSWKAHGLSYGIPADVKSFVQAGGTAVANGSRHALPFFAAVFPALTIVSITARPDVLIDRLRKRGRESETDIQNRLQRMDTNYTDFGQVVVIDNSCSLESAGDQLVSLIEASRSRQEQQTESAMQRFMENALPFP
jgi:ribose 1,5-bisphosphokinase